jgi:hypothetical protein
MIRRVISSHAKLRDRIIYGFCEYLYDVPVGSDFNLYNLQGALRFVNPGIPAKQKYSLLLEVAIREGWIKRITPKERKIKLPGVAGKTDAFRRITFKRSPSARLEFRRLEQEIKFALIESGCDESEIEPRSTHPVNVTPVPSNSRTKRD